MKKLIMILMIFVCSLILVACKSSPDKDPDDHGDDPDDEVEVTIESIKLANDGIFAFDYDNFFLSDLTINVKYSDGTSKDVPVTRNMLSLGDFEKTLIAGEHVLNIRYLDEDLPCMLILNATGGGQNRMGTVVLYSLASQDEGEVNYDFYIAGQGSMVAFELKYTGLGQLISLQLTASEELSGVFLSNTTQDVAHLTYSHGERLIAHTFVYSFAYTGELKGFSNHASIAATFYDFDEQVFVVQNIRVVYR